MLRKHPRPALLAGASILLMAEAQVVLAELPLQAAGQAVPRSCKAVDAARLSVAADHAHGELELPSGFTILPDGDEVRLQLPPETKPMVYCVGFVEDGVVSGVIAAGPGAGQETGATVVALKVPGISFGLPRKRQLVLMGFVPPSAEDTSAVGMADQVPDSFGGEISLAAADRMIGSGSAWTPALVLSRSVIVSDRLFSLAGALVGVTLFYLLAALALRGDARRAAFNPVFLTSGQFGKASLSQFQIFAFTLLVVGLLIYIILRTGALSDISPDVLMLLGISAVGAGGSKLAAVAKKRLSMENWTWLRERGWLTAFEKGTGQKADPKEARWGDLLKSGDDFDIYKFQLVTVSAVVALALLTGDQTQLASFSIPPNLLALLGLSNAVYIGAKAVTPNSFEDLNKKIDAVRQAEKALFRSTAAKGAAGDKRSEPKEQYLAAAREAAEMLRQVYGASGTRFGSGPIMEQKLLPETA